MSRKLRVGDVVVITDRDSRYYGKTGVVGKIFTGIDLCKVKIKGNRTHGYYSPSGLELMELNPLRKRVLAYCKRELNSGL